ncbi:hypothetical protein KBW81_18310 (plasmid) [Loktanella salsilacus]|uniref:hypothetical protein n=1 Tax=Loktanella salsilacus TaxID=195913 RepID=UPI0020B68A22|nr:hypothetical protein [Loktanella salsilacus]UTH50132.1 hypothetical protein KBW81_18310 [Loktanella salsilacus]
MIRVDTDTPRHDAQGRALPLLEEMGIPRAASYHGAAPHRLSGGARGGSEHVDGS